MLGLAAVGRLGLITGRHEAAALYNDGRQTDISGSRPLVPVRYDDGLHALLRSHIRSTR